MTPQQRGRVLEHVLLAAGMLAALVILRGALVLLVGLGWYAR